VNIKNNENSISDKLEFLTIYFLTTSKLFAFNSCDFKDALPMATSSSPLFLDWNRDDASDDAESAEKVFNGAGVEDPMKDCWPKLNGAADEPTKPSWATFEP